jgi:hypothetical protein
MSRAFTVYDRNFDTAIRKASLERNFDLKSGGGGIY